MIGKHTSGGHNELATPQEALPFFSHYCDQVMKLMRTPKEFRRWMLLYRQPVDNWTQGRVALLGDAAHAMVPFHGQGMNCAFEDCVALDRHIAEAPDFETAFAGFEAERRPNAEAIQAMALENYIEMRDRVDDADFLLQRALERVLAERHPGVFVPRYSMVSFLRVPYATAFERGKVQRQILVESTRGCAGLDDVDLVAADARVRERLAGLDP